MKLLDMLMKSKKPAEKRAENALGVMWACVVKCMPWQKDWYDVSVKEAAVVEAVAMRDGVYVRTVVTNPFNNCDPVGLCGYVGELNYAQEQHYWVGFFETEEKAKAAYRELAEKLIADIEAKSQQGLALPEQG